MDPEELQSVFPSGSLCRVTLASAEVLEVHPAHFRFTDDALVLRGTWDLVTKEEEVPMIGARVIPWAQITDMDCSSPVRNWNREDLERDIKRYGVADAEAQMFLTWV